MNEGLWIPLITFLGGLVISIATALVQEMVKGDPQLARRLLYSISIGLLFAIVTGIIVFKLIPPPPPPAFDFENGINAKTRQNLFEHRGISY